MARPVIVVEDDPFLRIIGVVLDPATSAERVAAFADFFACDLPDFAGWLEKLRAGVPAMHPAEVRLVESEANYRRDLAEADAAVLEWLPLGADELASAPRLRAVHKFGTIAGSIDREACEARGIPVLTLRRRANIACAEHAFYARATRRASLDRRDDARHRSSRRAARRAHAPLR